MGGIEQVAIGPWRHDRGAPVVLRRDRWHSETRRGQRGMRLHRTPVARAVVALDDCHWRPVAQRTRHHSALGLVCQHLQLTPLKPQVRAGCVCVSTEQPARSFQLSIVRKLPDHNTMRFVNCGAWITSRAVKFVLRLLSQRLERELRAVGCGCHAGAAEATGARLVPEVVDFWRSVGVGAQHGTKEIAGGARVEQRGQSAECRIATDQRAVSLRKHVTSSAALNHSECGSCAHHTTPRTRHPPRAVRMASHSPQSCRQQAPARGRRAPQDGARA